MELCGSKVQLAPPHRNFISGIANSEIVYLFIFGEFNVPDKD